MNARTWHHWWQGHLPIHQCIPSRLGPPPGDPLQLPFLKMEDVLKKKNYKLHFKTKGFYKYTVFLE
jgi:hypothetical protein